MSGKQQPSADIAMSKWVSMGGEEFGSINCSCHADRLYEVFIVLDETVPHLTVEEVSLTWNFFNYIQTYHDEATLSILHGENEDGNPEDVIHILFD